MRENNQECFTYVTQRPIVLNGALQVCLAFPLSRQGVEYVSMELGAFHVEGCSSGG